MTGDEVRALRISLGLSQGQLREVIGVGAMTVGRWEDQETQEISADPRNRELLELMARLVSKRSPEQARALGRRISYALGLKGGLYALHRVLAVAFVDEFDGANSAAEAS